MLSFGRYIEAFTYVSFEFVPTGQNTYSTWCLVAARPRVFGFNVSCTSLDTTKTIKIKYKQLTNRWLQRYVQCGCKSRVQGTYGCKALRGLYGRLYRSSKRDFSGSSGVSQCCTQGVLGNLCSYFWYQAWFRNGIWGFCLYNSVLRLLVVKSL